LGVKADGTVWAWGQNAYGQLGGGTADFNPHPIPAQVAGLAGVVAVAAGECHSLAVKSDGTVWAWGYNKYGQLGDGTTTQRTTPVQVLGLSGVVAVAGGGSHSLAIRSDGTVWAWGYNSYGQLGDGTTTNRPSPVQVVGLSGAVAPAGGGSHSLVVKSDGVAWAWGGNGDGELGDRTTTLRPTPVQVSGLSGAVEVAAGGSHSMFLADEKPPTAPQVAGTWPDNGSTERYVARIIVGFDRPMVNVSPDDLTLSAGLVTGVDGSGKGPYLFTVTGLPGGAITATIGGDTASLDGVALSPHAWTFQMLCPGDADGDGHADVADLLILAGCWGKKFGQPAYDPRCDFNADGRVNILDLLMLVNNWGTQGTAVNR
jgi:hypothetical protein